MALWKDGTFISDSWHYVEEGQDPSPAGHVILTLDWWQNMRDVFLPSNVPVGVKILAGEDISSIADDLHRLSLVALDFPAYTDGRSFSKAQVLREEYGYQHEIRATGDILTDQISILHRCGFDTLEVTDSNTLEALQSGNYWTQCRFYQPSAIDEMPAGSRPWLRRSGSR